jgi:exodeoxyribonuclease V gamma subunit
MGVRVSHRTTADLDVAYSNETERLVDLLAARLLAHRGAPGSNPFALATIAVPNLNLAQWIQFRLAERLGAAAGLDFIFLEKVFRRVILTYIPKARIIDKSLLQTLLIEYFRTEPWRINPKLEPVERYLRQNSGSGRSRERSQRLFDLSSSLAKAFDDYAMSRRDLLARWKKNQTTLPRENRSHTTEIWQSEVWRALFLPGGTIDTLAANQQTRMGMLVDLFTEALQATDKGASETQIASSFGSSEQMLHIFGFSYVASSYFDMLSELARHIPIRIYTLNPCQEYWEDSETLKEEHSRAKRFRVKGNKPRELEGDDPFGLISSGNENLLLRLWGRPGRENIRVLNALTDCTFSEIFSEPTDSGNHLLAQIRAALLHRQTIPDTPVAPDDSLVYLRCRGGVRREVEAIAGEIWRLVASSEKGPNRLRFNEIAIIVGASTQEHYESAIRSVFDECHRLPFRMADSTSRSASPMVDALFTLLESGFSEVTRASLLRFLTHNAVVVRHQGNPDIWTRLAEEAHIYVGADLADLAGTYIDRDLYNWDQGLLRLALGTCMSGEHLGDNRLLTLGKNRYLPTDISPALRGSVERFVVLARALLSDLKFLRTESCHATRWADFFTTFIHTYLGAYEGEPPAEADMRASCARAAQDLAHFDCGPDSHFDGFTALQFFSDSLARIKPGQAGFLVDGVVVASFLPMRPIPFKVIFVVGMGEGKFPTADSLNALDLRSAKRRASDVSPREQDKYMFLETILSCREKLYVSWIARDEVSDDSIEPSGIVKELNQALIEMGFSLDALKGLERVIPHRRFDPSLFDSNNSEASALPAMLFPEAWRERHATEAANAQRVEEETTVAAATSSLSSATPPPAGRPLHRIQAFELTRFLNNPLLATAENRYGIRIEEYDDPVAVVSEPHVSENSEQRTRINALLFEAWASLPNDAKARKSLILESHTKAYEMAQTKGTTPIGILAQTEIEAERTEIEAMDRLMTLWQSEFNTPTFRPISIGRVRNRLTENIPPLRLELPEQRQVELSAELELALVGPEQALLVTSLWGSSETLPIADTLKLFLILSIAVAAGIPFPARTVLAALPRRFDGGDIIKWIKQVRTPTPDEARVWLQTLLVEWLEAGAPHYLPATLLEHKEIVPLLGSTDESSRTTVQEVARDLWQTLLETDPNARGNSAGLKLRKTLGRIDLYPPPPEALTVLQRRFGLFLSHLVHTEKSSRKGGKA